MRILFYYLGCVIVIAFMVLGLMASCSPQAHAAPPQLLPHTVAAGTCDLWEAKYKNDPDALGWIHFEDVVVRGYRDCSDCEFVGKYQQQHFNRPGWTLEYHCVARAKAVPA